MLAYQHVLLSLVLWVIVLCLGYLLRNDYLIEHFNLFALVSLVFVLVLGVLVDIDHFNRNNLREGVSCALASDEGSLVNKCRLNLDDNGFLHSKWFGVCIFVGLLAWCLHLLADYHN